MKIKTYLIASLAIGVTLFSNGCAMMGMHQMMSLPAAGSAPSGFNEGGDQRTSIQMEVPPLVAGRESTIQVRLKDRESGEPVSEAKVTAAIEQSDAEGSEGEPTILQESQANRGTFALNFRPEEAGPKRISVTAQRTDESPPSSPLILSTTQSVTKESGVLGKATMWMGGLCMGVMMVGMMLL